MTLNIWQNFFHIATIFCIPNIHYVKILHIKFEEIPIIDARVTSLQHSYFYIEMYGDTAGVRTPVL